MPVQAWFPTLIYDAPLARSGGAPLRRALLDDCRKIQRVDAAGRRWSAVHYPSGFTSYASMSKLHRSFSTFRALEKVLDRHVRAFARALELELGERRLRMTDCWVNVMPRHAVHALHLHPLSVVSGTFYVRTPPGASRIRFEDPRLDKLMASPPRRQDGRPENRQQVTYAVAAGRVILFESWLRHEVPPSRVGGERVSISFNYDWQ